MQQIHATFNALLHLQIPTLATHNLPALEHLGVAQICLIKPWYLEGFVTGHIYDYKANKTQKKPPSLTEIFINVSPSAQKCMPFSEGFVCYECIMIYPSISYGL